MPERAIDATRRMSAVAPSITADPSPAARDAAPQGDAAPPRDAAPSRDAGPVAPAVPRAKKLRGLMGRNIWALADQALISGANFVTLILIAWALDDKTEFGRFSTVYSVLLFCNILQSTLITQSHNVLGATRSGDDYRLYTSSTAFGQLALFAIQVLLVLPVATLASMQGWATASLIWALIPAVFGWQLQELVRRVLYTEGRYGAAFANDLIGFGGQMLVLAGMFFLHARMGYTFNGTIALLVTAATTALAGAVGLWQLRASLSWRFGRRELAENWHFGKWLLGGEVLGFFSSLQMQVLWAALLVGTAASADLRAAQILFGPMRVITFFLGTVLPIRFARALHERGTLAMHANVRSVYAVLAPLVGVYCALLALFPRPLLKLIYPDEFASNEAVVVLMLYAATAFLGYMQMVMAAALTAARQTRYIFAGSVCGCAIGLAASPLCIWRFGAAGGILSIMATTLVVTALYVLAYRRQSARDFGSSNSGSIAGRGAEVTA